MFILLLDVAKRKIKIDFTENENKLLFAIICMQLEFKEMYYYLLNNSDSIAGALLNNLKNEEHLQKNVEEIWGNKFSKDEIKFVLKKTTKFMQALWDTMDEDKDNKLSDEEIEKFTNILMFSSITSVSTSIDKTKQGRMITYDNWDEFEKEQSAKDSLKKKFMPIAKEVHDLIIEALDAQNIPYEVRYGGGTFSFSVPIENAKSRTRTFARFGLLSLAKDRCYVDSLHKDASEKLPKKASFDKKDDPTKYYYRFVSMDDFEELKQDIKEGVIRSYKILAK